MEATSPHGTLHEYSYVASAPSNREVSASIAQHCLALYRCIAMFLVSLLFICISAQDIVDTTCGQTEGKIVKGQVHFQDEAIDHKRIGSIGE